MDPEYPTNPNPDQDADDRAWVDRADFTADPEADAAADPVQSTVRTLLRTSADPGPMPADVARRIEDSLGQAAVRRAGDRELFDELGFDDPQAVFAADEPDDVVVFHGGSEGRSRAEGTAVPFVRRRWPMVGVAAAGVAVLAVAGVVVVNQTRSGSGLAAIPAQNGSAGSVHVQVSTTAYTKDGLATGARTLLDSPGPDASVGDAPSSGPLVTQAGAAACVAALGASDAGAVSIDLASYEGQPAAIVVVRRSDSTVVYAVQRDCGDGDAGVIQGAVPVP
jgi:hypothetical protein